MSAERKSVMKFGKFISMMFLSVFVAVIVVGGCFYRGYNRAIALDEQVRSAWAQVESQLQRRFDLVPNLVETVKGVAGQEQEIFLGIARAREAYFQSEKGSVAERARSAGEYSSALSRLLVFSENYPELRSSESFQKLQDSIEGTENRLAVERQRYNESVKTLNSFTRKLLGRMYASLASVKEAQYFEIQEAAKAAPKVDFRGGKP